VRHSLLALGILVAAALLASRAQAQNYPWCAVYSGQGGTNCGFSTFQQCLDTIRGMGGSCNQNTEYVAPGHAAAPHAATTSTPAKTATAPEHREKPKPHESLVAPQPQ
jgi:hypothetical protein